MSNVIKPKRGTTDPAPGILAEGEIGINTSAATAFVGVAGGSKKLNAARSEETDSVDTSGEATANGNRHIWFSDLDNEKVRAYNGNFQYNPATNTISSNVGGTSSNVTGTVSIAHGGTGATTRQDAAFNILCGNTYTGDLNDNTDVGTFWVNLSRCTNGPASSGYGILQMVKASSGLRQQTFTFYSSGEIWVRTYTNSRWYNWYAAAKLSDEYLIRYQDIPDGADLNDDAYRMPGYYRSTSAKNNILNAPQRVEGAFEMVVTGIADGTYCTQTVKDYRNNYTYVRTQSNWTTPWNWTDWMWYLIPSDLNGCAKLQSPNNLIHAGNEFTFVAPQFSNDIWLNYRTASWNTDGNIGTYMFGNGKGGLARIQVAGITAPEVADSGWKNASITGSFSLYGSDSVLRYRKIGRIVQVEGTIRPTTTLSGSATNLTIFTLPDGYRPSAAVVTLCQGSGSCNWALTIKANGEVCFARYSSGGSYTSAGTGTWLPFHHTFMV